MKLISQIQAMIFLAFPVEERERGESGWQIAKYLEARMNNMTFYPTTVIFSPIK
jgi:hypothetical protein